MAYIDRSLVIRYLGIDSGEDDALLDDLLLHSQQMIDSHTHRTFEQGESTETRAFDVGIDTDGNTLYFADMDIAEITTVTNGDDVVVVSTDYVTIPRNRPPYYGITLKPSSGLSWLNRNDDPLGAILVEGQWVYSLSAPDDIKQAMLRLVSFLYRQKDTSTDLDRPVVSPDGIMLMPSTIPSDVKMILDPYRLRYR